MCTLSQQSQVFVPIPNHFDPDYFSGGVKWDLPDLMNSEVSYLLARDIYKAFDRKIVNSTIGGHLEVFPRESLENFLNS